MRIVLASVAALCLLACSVPAAAGPSLGAKLEALSAKGSGEAAYHLGMLHHLGLEGTDKDARKAFQLFKLAADRGDPLGAYKLGCFYDGQGDGVVESDAQLALRNKLVAAQAGYSRAQSDVARHYFGIGKVDQALHWLETAAVQGEPTAMMALASLYSPKSPVDGVPRDPVKSYVYTMLLFASAPKEMAEARSQAEAELKSGLSVEQLAQGQALVRAWRAKPSQLTEKANSGLSAAERLAGS
jgi:TPR repeat protein